MAKCQTLVFSGENFIFYVIYIQTAVFSGENFIFYLDYGQMPNTYVLRRELEFFFGLWPNAKQFVFSGENFTFYVIDIKMAVFSGEKFIFSFVNAKCQNICVLRRELDILFDYGQMPNNFVLRERTL